jgi:anti-anti-sigma factor
MDLRLHMPRTDVVIVRVSGAVDPVAAPVLAALVGKQLLRVLHVVLDLGEVTVLGPQGLAVLLMLYQEAMARGVELYVVGVERDAVRRPLHARGLAQLVRFDATVDAVVAPTPTPGPLTRRLSPGLIVTIRIRRVALIRITLARSDLLANTARGALRSRHPAWSCGLPDRRLGRPGPTTLLRRMAAGVPTPRRRRRPSASTTPQRAEFHR